MKGITPDVPKAWRLQDQIKKLASKKEWPYLRLQGQVVVAAVLARAGLGDSARRVLARSQGSPTIDPERDLPYSEAFVRTLLGEKDKALELLQRYLAEHEERRSDLARDYMWWFRDLRSDPRYQQLIK